MKKPAPNFKLLVLSAVLFLVGVGNLVYIVVSSASSFNKEMVRIEMPGVATVQLPDSGLQQVFHEWKSSSERQIGNLTLAVTDPQGKKLEVQPLEGVSYRVNDTSGLLFLRGLQLQRKSRELVQATQLAKTQLEALRLLPSGAHPSAPSFRYDGRNPDPASAGYPPAPYPSLALDGREYAMVVDFKPHPDGLRKVRVEVHSGTTRVVLESLFAP